MAVLTWSSDDRFSPTRAVFGVHDADLGYINSSVIGGAGVLRSKLYVDTCPKERKRVEVYAVWCVFGRFLPMRCVPMG